MIFAFIAGEKKVVLANFCDLGHTLTKQPHLSGFNEYYSHSHLCGSEYYSTLMVVTIINFIYNHDGGLPPSSSSDSFLV
jgi:hypothetical protein